MTDDLVKRLNEDFSVNAREDINHQMKVYEAERKEAADRIEELEAALREIIVHCEVPAPPNADALKMFARKALEGKDD